LHSIWKMCDVRPCAGDISNHDDPKRRTDVGLPGE
jgi:hypothetical protein